MQISQKEILNTLKKEGITNLEQLAEAASKRAQEKDAVGETSWGVFITVFIH